MRIHNTISCYITDIKEDTVVCTPLYPVSEATGLQLVYSIFKQWAWIIAQPGSGKVMYTAGALVHTPQ